MNKIKSKKYISIPVGLGIARVLFTQGRSLLQSPYVTHLPASCIALSATVLRVRRTSTVLIILLWGYTKTTGTV